MAPHRTKLAGIAGIALTLGMITGQAEADDSMDLAPLYSPPTIDDGEPTQQATGLWFVELESPARLDRAGQARLQQEQREFRANARADGLKYNERMTFDTLWNGMSVELGTAELDTLRGIQGVKAVYPVLEVELPETTDVSPDLATALGMTGADIAQSELGLTGEGVRVAVMDTGIDFNHPDLGGSGDPSGTEFPTSRIVAGHDFVGDDYNAADPDHLVPQPDPVPNDCYGHGTHVAGIVGASGEVTGVAPDVTFGAYRVFGCQGSTTSDIMIAAMERALADDMDVLNMSIGSAFSWPQYPTATASDNLVKHGVSVVASIGNSGANGVYSAGAPGLGKDVIGVASYDNSHINALTFDVNPSGQKVPYLPLATTPDPPTSGDSGEVVYVGRGCLTEDNEVNPPVPPGGDPYLDDPEGKVALIIRGDCAFQDKYQRAVDAGAVGVVVHNQSPGLFAGGGVTPRDVAGVGISLADGEHIRSQLDAGETVTLSWTDERVNAANPIGGLISSFSSYGMAPDLSVKPDIGAPGGLIRSTYPLDQGGYATISGTSMASPHVAGGVALLLEARPKLKTSDVRRVLQNSADPALWWGNPDLGFLDNVHRQGAGMLDIPGAVQTTTTVTPGTLALGENESGPTKQRLKITNRGPDTATYQLSHTPALGTHGDTFAPAFNASFADATFSKDTVTLRPRQSAVVLVTITAPEAEAPNMQYGGYVEVTQDTGETTRVPYAGFAGDYQSIEAMTPTDLGLPLLTKITSCDGFIGLECVAGASYSPQPDGATYSLATVDGLPDIPYLAVHFDHQVQQLEIVVLDAATGEPLPGPANKAVDLAHVERSATPSAFFAYAWDGTVTGQGTNKAHNVPDGQYLLQARALKALGNPKNPDHWETWTSPTLTIDRP